MSHDDAAWVLDELAHAGRENLDPTHVAHYDDKEEAGAATELAMLLALGLATGSTVVDLGAGTGQFSVAAAAAMGRVVAVDVSPVMLGHLRAKVERLGLGNVECVHAGFLSYEHRGGAADLVYSRYALHHLPDFWKAIALTRMAAMLGTGGILRLSDAVYGFAPTQARAHLERWMASVPADAVSNAWTRLELEEHVRDEHSTFTWLLEPMIERAGFAIERADYSDDLIFAHYICRKLPDY